MQATQTELIFRDPEIIFASFEKHLRKVTNYFEAQKASTIYYQILCIYVDQYFCDLGHLKQNSHHIKISSCLKVMQNILCYLVKSGKSLNKIYPLKSQTLLNMHTLRCTRAITWMQSPVACVDWKRERVEKKEWEY